MSATPADRPVGADGPASTAPPSGGGGRTVLPAVAWLWVLIPFVYGVVMLVLKLPALF